MTLLYREATVVLLAYALAALPIAAAIAAGKASPLYQLPAADLARWWSRFALAIVLTTLLCNLAGAA